MICMIFTYGQSAIAHTGIFSTMLSSFAAPPRLSSVIDEVMDDNLPIWGSFRPGLYFGMKSRYSKESVSTGLMWAPSASGRGFRHQTNQDELMFEWLKHDGTNYGIESMIDAEYGLHLNATFIIPDSSTTQQHRPAWVQRITMQSNRKAKNSMLFYFGLDDVKSNKFKNMQVHMHKSTDNSFDNAIRYKEQ